MPGTSGAEGGLTVEEANDPTRSKKRRKKNQPERLSGSFKDIRPFSSLTIPRFSMFYR
jgi:hypothetical protein